MGRLARPETVARLLETSESVRVFVYLHDENGPTYGTLDYATREAVTVGGMRILFGRVKRIETPDRLILYDEKRG